MSNVLRNSISPSQPWRWAHGLSPRLLRPQVGLYSEGGVRAHGDVHKQWLQIIKLNARKRQTTQPLNILEDDSDISFPRFLVVKAAIGAPFNYSIFTKQKFLRCAVVFKSAKTLWSCTVLIGVDTKHMAMRALGITTWLDNEVRVSPLRSLNSRCCIFRDCEDALWSRDFVRLGHIMLREENRNEQMNTWILTFLLQSHWSLWKLHTYAY